MKLTALTAIGFVVLTIFIATITSCQSDEQIEFNRYYSSGSLVYQVHCQNCHGQHGEGLQALIPPLTDTAYLKANKATLGCTVKNGLKGKVSIANRQFEAEMPASGLPSVHIAEALTYVTNSFGNKLGIITSEQVEQNSRNCK